MLTGGKVTSVDLKDYLKKSGYGVVGYADISDYIDPCDFEKNISSSRKSLESNFCDWDPSGTMCVDVINAGLGSSFSDLKKDIQKDYKTVENSYPTKIGNAYFWRRNTTYVQFFKNTRRFR